MASNVLAEKDVNTPIAATNNNSASKDVKSLEYHRQVLQDKMAQENSKTYVSPSDNIMSPCTAKLNALRNKQVGKVKPKSLFAQHSSKKLGGDNLFDSRMPSAPQEKAL